MRIFTCNDFVGRWPVGTAAVVIADSMRDAEMHLAHALRLRGLGDEMTFTLQEMDPNTQKVVILADGDY